MHRDGERWDLEFEMARVTIEAVTPLTVSTRTASDLDDSVCVTDANGYPTIPGTSLAGFLRDAWEANGVTPTNDLFGFQDGDQGASSRLEVSWALCHDATDTPVQPLRRAPPDEVLEFLALGVQRDHVRLNARGAADERGKFDERLVPRGARFTFELLLKSPRPGELERLLDILASKHARLGGRTRRGFGRFIVVRADTARFDLRVKDCRELWVRVPVDLHEALPEGFARVKSPDVSMAHHISVSLQLEAVDFWVFGGGDPTRPAHADARRVRDILPMSESSVRWKEQGGRWRGSVCKNLVLVPASSVKGALRHRVAFHARRLARKFAGSEQIADEPEEVLQWFGRIRGGSGAAVSGHPGRVFLSDLYLPLGTRASVDGPVDGTLQHVSIDRFSGAPISGALFSEAPLFKGAVTLEVVLNVKDMDELARAAMGAALDDLCQGRLALGAGSSRGHGYFQGSYSPPCTAWSADS